MKFSELTLDMFRMLQTLEREPQEDLNNQIYDASPAPGRTPFISVSIDEGSHIKVPNTTPILSVVLSPLVLIGNAKLLANAIRDVSIFKFDTSGTATAEKGWPYYSILICCMPPIIIHLAYNSVTLAVV